MIITIDGPSGTGKTTIARLIAERLGFSYFDTGAMYRAFSWYLLDRQIDPSDLDSVEKALQHFHFQIVKVDDGRRYLVGNQDVTDQIRSKIVTDLVSQVSSYKLVRELLSKTQREYGQRGNAVFEGRDLGTVIFPAAEIKIFLTARAEVRAKRRFVELSEKNYKQKLTEQEILESINRRDEYDSTREIAPLRCADDAITVDTSDLTIEQVVDKILFYIRQRESL